MRSERLRRESHEGGIGERKGDEMNDSTRYDPAIHFSFAPTVAERERFAGWQRLLRALGCPDRPARYNPDDDSFSWNTATVDDLPARLRRAPTGLHCSLSASGTNDLFHNYLRAYPVAGGVLVLELLTDDEFRTLTVGMCDTQYDAGHRAGQIIEQWGGVLGLEVRLRLASEDWAESHETAVGADL